MKRIVIAGGGMAGSTVISELLKSKVESEIILIDPREYLEVPIGELRALVNHDEFAPTIRRTFRDIYPGIRHHQSKLKEVGESQVLLENGESVDSDYLVLATGSRFTNWPLLKGDEASVVDRQKAFDTEGRKLDDASTVLIVGGGPVGVELAGEIAEKWPSKEVTLIQGGERILNSLSLRSSAKAVRVLREMGVKILTNKRLSKGADGVWTDEKGEIYQADVVYPALGLSVNSAFASASPLIQTDEKGFVKVEKDLRVLGSSNIFAVGDVNDVPEIKLAATGSIQAKTTAKNIIKLLKNERSRLRDYKAAQPMGFITLGRKKGIAQLPFGNLDFMIGMKQKDLFIPGYLGT